MRQETPWIIRDTCTHLQCLRVHVAKGLCKEHYRRVLDGRSIATAIGQLEPKRATGPKKKRRPLAYHLDGLAEILELRGDAAAWARRNGLRLDSLAAVAWRTGRDDLARVADQLSRLHESA